MKELREGLILAMIHRERFNKHVHTALAEYDNELEKYLGLLDVFDKTVKDVFQVRELNYFKDHQINLLYLVVVPRLCRIMDN